MQPLRISLLQAELVWENHDANRDRLAKMMDSVSETPDIFVLPEMFTTGFSMNPEKLAEEENGITVQWLKTQAASRDCVITGSIIVKEEGRYYNRLIWMRPDGSYERYDKRHLFSLAGEDKPFTAGKEKLIVECKGWRIMPLICYDLRFPVWARYNNDYDLIIYTANWPNKRNFAWKTLLRARAIENQCYVAGNNIVGTDGNGLQYSGDSCIVDPLGETLAEASGSPAVITAIIQPEVLHNIRTKLAFLNDADDFSINP